MLHPAFRSGEASATAIGDGGAFSLGADDSVALDPSTLATLMLRESLLQQCPCRELRAVVASLGIDRRQTGAPLALRQQPRNVS